MKKLKAIVECIELHDVEGIRNCFEEGVSPNETYNTLPLIYEVIGEYTRSPKFKECIKAFVDYGLIFDDKVLLAVLLDDAIALEKYIANKPETVTRIYSLKCAYTPLMDASLLHICAEFNHVASAKILVAKGANVNSRAGLDEYGYGGHTPIFHTVNQNSNQSAEMMAFLLEVHADLLITVKGLIWGKGYDWETLIPAVNPISYAMMGLLPQMHRDEKTISNTVTTLIRHAYGIKYNPTNIPNKYLKQ